MGPTVERGVLVAKAARELGVCRSTVWRWIQSGLLDAGQYTKRSPYRISRTSLDQLLQRVQPKKQIQQKVK